MFRVIFFIGLFICLVGCGSGKDRPTKQVHTVVKDSTITEVRYQRRDTVITIPGDTLRFQIPIKEITHKPQTFSQGYQTVSVSKDENDTLSVDCITAEMQRLIELQDEIRTTLRNIETSKQETITVPEPYTPWYTKALAWLGGIVLAVLGIGLILKFKP